MFNLATCDRIYYYKLSFFVVKIAKKVIKHLLSFIDTNDVLMFACMIKIYIKEEKYVCVHKIRKKL